MPLVLSPQLSADELLPMFIAALVAACPPHLPSTLEYLLSFHTEVRMGGHEAPVTTPAELLSCAGLQGDLQGKGGYLLAMLEVGFHAPFICWAHWALAGGGTSLAANGNPLPLTLVVAFSSDLGIRLPLSSDLNARHLCMPD